MQAVQKITIPRADYPEQVGVSSLDIADYIRDCKESNIEVHSIMIIRDGKIAFETWREPYTPDMPHTMYSVSKSVTSIAAGFAIEEGLFALDTKVLDIFPEYRTLVCCPTNPKGTGRSSFWIPHGTPIPTTTIGAISANVHTWSAPVSAARAECPSCRI